MAFAKFQENRFRIDGEIAENHAILVNLTASINPFGNKLNKKYIYGSPRCYTVRCAKIPLTA